MKTLKLFTLPVIALLSTWFFVFLINSNLQAQENNDPLTVTAQVKPYEITPGLIGEIEFKLQLPPHYHAYVDQFKIEGVSPAGFKYSQPKISPIIKMFDKFTKKERMVIENTADLKVVFEAPLMLTSAETQLQVNLTYQACSEQVCFFPITKLIQIPANFVGFQMAVEMPMASFFSLENFQMLLNQSLFISLIFVFLAGIFTSFTPCIFPMIPITLAILGKDSEKHSKLQNFLISIFYVHGIATTYSILGVIAAKSGNVFGASLGSPVVLTFICVIFLAMALSMYGLFEIQVPNYILQKFGSGSKRKGYLGAYLSGTFAGLVASPCVGPVLVAILAFVATKNNVFIGFIMLFTYAVGMGLIFILLGLSNQFTHYLPKSGQWMNMFKFTLGSLMLIGFYYYLDQLVSAQVFDFLLGIGLLTLSSIYGAFETIPHTHSHKMLAFYRIKKAIMLSMLYLGISFLAVSVFNLRPLISEGSGQITGGVGGVSKIEQTLKWDKYEEPAFNQSLKMKNPVVLDLFADWCVACHELEEKTFSNPEVASNLGKFKLYRFDATNSSEELSKLKSKYNIQGLPTVLFFDENGEWLKDMTLTQFENPESFNKRISRILK